METVVVAAVVSVAGIWCGLRVFRRRKSNACAAGCSGCSAASSPKPLVQIRR